MIPEERAGPGSGTADALSGWVSRAERLNRDNARASCKYPLHPIQDGATY